MASYLDANPDDARAVADHRRTGQMVPIASGGMLVAFANRRSLDTIPIASPLPVEDYVVGLELLGFHFRVATPGDGSPEFIFRREPDEAPPPGWDRQELRIVAAFGPGRIEEIVSFLRARDSDTPNLSPPTATDRPPISEAKGFANAAMFGTAFWCGVLILLRIAR